MNARRLAAAAVVVAVVLTGCSSSSPKSGGNPDLRPHGDEAPVAVTTLGGAENLPTWRREDGRATLVVPADLLFATDSADLAPAADGPLHLVVAELRGTTAHVLVEGFADSDGDAIHNQDLSERRADAVARRLTAMGIDPSTITIQGWGESRPAVVETDDDDTKAENRRVVITVTLAPAATVKPIPTAATTTFRQPQTSSVRLRVGRSHRRPRQGAEPPQRRSPR